MQEQPKSAKDLYSTYPNDGHYMPIYMAYQRKWRSSTREFEKISINTIANYLNSLSQNEKAKILDIGCSTGNFLKHVRDNDIKAELYGGDLSESSIQACKKDPALTGINFEVLDLLNVTQSGAFDVVNAGAVLYGFEERDFNRAIANIGKALRKGGLFIAYDFYHRFKQELSIIERTSYFPEGHPIHIRSFESVETTLRKCGFRSIEFFPFNISIDLTPADPDDPVMTRTRLVEGERLQFRGSIYEPWCHLIARL